MINFLTPKASSPAENKITLNQYDIWVNFSPGCLKSLISGNVDYQFIQLLYPVSGRPKFLLNVKHFSGWPVQKHLKDLGLRIQGQVI